MRLWGFVLLECLALGGAAGALVAGIEAEVRKLTALQRPAAAPATGEADDDTRFDPAPVDVAADATGTFFGVKDELLLERMRTAPLVQAKPNKGGSSISFRLDFADGSRAAFKPEQTNPQTVPRKEVAAYRLSRWLGFHAVPPATMRSVRREELIGKLHPEAAGYVPRIDAEVLFDPSGATRGEVSFWIPVIVDSHLDSAEALLRWGRWLTVGEAIPDGEAGLMSQLSSLLIFDMLTNNSDRFSGGNLMTSKDGRTLYWMDNTFGFQLEPDGHTRCRAALFRCQKFSRRLVAELRALDRAAVRQALAPEPGTLSELEIAALLSRKEVVLTYIDQLIAQFGSERVLAFP